MATSFNGTNVYAFENSGYLWRSTTHGSSYDWVKLSALPKAIKDARVATSGTGNVIVLCGRNPEDHTGRIAISLDSGITWKYPHDVYTNKIFTSVSISFTGKSIALSGPSVLFMGEFDETSNFYNFLPVSGPEADMVIGLQQNVMTNFPTIAPSPGRPTKIPTFNPTYRPTVSPTFKPTYSPSVRPSRKPTRRPTYRPTITKEPTKEPTNKPTEMPTISDDMQTDCTSFNCILRIENPNGISLGEIEIYLSGNKIPYQGWISSILEPIENCMDGDYNTKCSTEVHDPQPKIEISLTGLKFDTIEIWNRADCCFDSIVDTTLLLLTDDGGMLWIDSINPDPSTNLLPTYTFIPALGPAGSPSPTVYPTTYKPTVSPTRSPTLAPSRRPTKLSNEPTRAPTTRPTRNPTELPTFKPSVDPTFKPTFKPTRQPTSRERYQCTPQLFDNCCSQYAYILFTNVLEIPDEQFMNCNNIVWVTIPSTVVSIGDNAFKGCSNLNTLIIQEGVTYIGPSAFEGTAIKSLTLPLSLTVLGAAAFKDNVKMTSLQIQSSIKSADDYTDRQFLSAISDDTFNGCKGLTSIVIPEGITSIGSMAFKDCDQITTVSIANSVTQIGSQAFSGVSINCNSIFWDENILRIVDDELLKSLSSCRRKLQQSDYDHSIDQYTETIAFDKFVFPYGLAVSPIDDNVYVTDPADKTISKIDVRTSRSTVLPITSTRSIIQFNPLGTPPSDNIIDTPTEIAIHPNGLIFVVDQRYSYPATLGVILVINPHTYVVKRFSSLYMDDLDSFLISPDGYIYISKPNTDSRSLHKFSTDTQGTSSLIWTIINISLEKLVFIGNELFSFSSNCSISKIDVQTRAVVVIDDDSCTWGVFNFTALGTIRDTLGGDILIGGTYDHMIEISIDHKHTDSLIEWNKLINNIKERVIPRSIAVTRGTNSIFAVLISEISLFSQVVKLSPPRSLQANYWNGHNNNNQRTATASNNGPINVVRPLWIYNGISTSSISSLVVDNHGVIYCIQNDRTLKIDADGSILDNLPGSVPISLTLGTTDVLYINDVTELRAIDVSNGMTTVWLLRDPNVNSNDAKLLGFSGGVLYTNNIIYATAFSGFFLS